MTGVTDQHDAMAVGRVAPGLDVHLRHERTRRVDRVETALGGVLVHRRRDAVGREHERRALRHVPLVVDEHGATALEVPDDVRVVDDLLADVDRGSVQG